MFRKSNTLKEEHSNVKTSKHIFSLGSTIDNLPKLTGFTFKELPLPENYTSPLENYSSTHINESYATKIYLPNHIFLLNFEFDFEKEKSDGLPKSTHSYITTEEMIDKKITTRQFLHRDKVEHQYVRRITTECVFLLGDLPLEEYLNTYGSRLNNVSKFLSIYIPAEKKFQRDVVLTCEFPVNPRQ